MKRLIALIVLTPGLVFCQPPVSTNPYVAPTQYPAANPYAYSFLNYFRTINSFDVLVYFVIFFSEVLSILV
jgi:hypothetical protein